MGFPRLSWDFSRVFLVPRREFVLTKSAFSFSHQFPVYQIRLLLFCWLKKKKKILSDAVDRNVETSKSVFESLIGTRLLKDFQMITKKRLSNDYKKKRKNETLMDNTAVQENHEICLTFCCMKKLTLAESAFDLI